MTDDAPGSQAPEHFETAGGNPVGPKRVMAHLLLKKLRMDFEVHGETVIQRVREEEPATYLKIVASMVPKEMDLSTPNGAGSFTFTWGPVQE